MNKDGDPTGRWSKGTCRARPRLRVGFLDLVWILANIEKGLQEAAAGLVVRAAASVLQDRFRRD